MKTIDEEEIVKAVAFEHNELDFEYWDAILEMGTTFKTTHIVWTIQRAKMLED